MMTTETTMGTMLKGVKPLGLLQVFLFPALGGLLFGYDIGATSFVLTQLQVRHCTPRVCHITPGCMCIYMLE